MIKRSLTIAGHRTSIALEAEFWTGLESMAEAHGVSLPTMISQVDEARVSNNLSSAVRLAVLAYYRDQAQASA